MECSGREGEDDTKTVKPAAKPADKKRPCNHYLHDTYWPIMDSQRDGEFKDTPGQKIRQPPCNVSQSHCQAGMLLREAHGGTGQELARGRKVGDLDG